MTTVTPRLDLDKGVLEDAKKTVARMKGLDPETANLERIAFSETVEIAVRTHLKTVLAGLKAIGMERQNPERGRPRRLDAEVWSGLEECKEKFDVSRISLLRAVLKLLAEDSTTTSKVALENEE